VSTSRDLRSNDFHRQQFVVPRSHVYLRSIFRFYINRSFSMTEQKITHEIKVSKPVIHTLQETLSLKWGVGGGGVLLGRKC
jgi:hypothetical protein